MTTKLSFGLTRLQNNTHNHKYTKPNVKHGGICIILWGCFFALSLRWFVKIEKQENLVKNVMQFARNRRPERRVVFQQGNGPKHKTKMTQESIKTTAFRSWKGTKSRSPFNEGFLSVLENSSSLAIPMQTERAAALLQSSRERFVSRYANMKKT